MSRQSEFTYCINSNSRDKKAYPNPNNALIPLSYSMKRSPVQSIHLGSFELPMTQYNIEAEWRWLRLDEGIEFQATLSPEQPNTEDGIDNNFRFFKFEVKRFVHNSFNVEDGYTEVIALPLWLNPIKEYIYNAGINTITFMFRHGL